MNVTNCFTFVHNKTFCEFCIPVKNVCINMFRFGTHNLLRNKKLFYYRAIGLKVTCQRNKTYKSMVQRKDFREAYHQPLAWWCQYVYCVTCTIFINPILDIEVSWYFSTNRMKYTMLVLSHNFFYFYWLIVWQCWVNR